MKSRIYFNPFRFIYLMQMVIGLTGLAGSSKGEACAYLKSRGFTVLSFSDILRDEATRRGILTGSLEEQKAALSRLGEQLRKESGDWGILARMLAGRVKTDTVVDGFRSVEEVNVFRESFPDSSSF
jgi:dephospho-CoA kinase